MPEETPKTIYLKDYKKPDFIIKETHLDFIINSTSTLVKSRLVMEQSDKSLENPKLELSGEKMELKSLKVNGQSFNQDLYDLTETNLTFQPKEKEFIVEIETEIEPQNNKALEGLYQSGDIFCTQCEPEGFRKITYFLDRSDVMSIYTTRIEADKSKYPILLSNGNKIDSGDLADGRHFVTWNDPFKKPSYLFALVAGDLALVTDSYKTVSGKNVALEIYVDHGNEDRSQHALDSLKKSMKWDEDTFGLEYDLDIYMIVAVDAFNMGAMENKGLNIFNTSCALANPKTATDANFQSIEGIIAHEYFHNWTGNRVTCRDWFQLTLKEGLTVFRDQQFSMDMTSRPVKRIEEVCYLRNSQFTEDSGPTAHPIKPESYIEINNFYTPTVYRKGAEVIRMIHTLIGVEAFRAGMDKYFELHDGEAVTTEDFVNAMELGSGRDLSQFKNWYSQAGTPRLDVSSEYDSSAKTFTLNVKQWCPATPESSDKKPFHMPLNLGLLDPNGKDLTLTTLSSGASVDGFVELTKESESFVFTGIEEKPVPSLLRDFSAPVMLNYDYSEAELAFLLANDTDEFNRYEAGQRLALIQLEKLITAYKAGNSLSVDSAILDAFKSVLADKNIDDAFKAEALGLPTVTTLVEAMDVCDYDAAFAARSFLRKSIASAHLSLFNEIYKSCISEEPYSVDPKDVGRRSLKNTCLSYISLIDEDASLETVVSQFESAANMTDEISALACLVHIDSPKAKSAIQDFYNKWHEDVLVMNKWFAVQAGSHLPNVLDRVKELEKDSAYDDQNPNKIRSLVGAFVGNVQYHAANGSGYKFLADKIIEIDKFNPSMSSGLARCFRKYAKLDSARKALMKSEMERILAVEGLSKDSFEIVSKTLNS
ncbi:MAG: aminopeptidase N [Lentisphaeraceae bacterium]|nr:aminopeptidase N [Lentisphaeraceae bacterium]